MLLVSLETFPYWPLQSEHTQSLHFFFFPVESLPTYLLTFESLPNTSDDSWLSWFNKIKINNLNLFSFVWSLFISIVLPIPSSLILGNLVKFSMPQLLHIQTKEVIIVFINNWNFIHIIYFYFICYLYRGWLKIISLIIRDFVRLYWKINLWGNRIHMINPPLEIYARKIFNELINILLQI